MKKIGIDIGRVIISGDTDVPDQFFGAEYLNVPPVAGSFEAIREIIEDYGPENVHLVSKCGERVQMRSLRWLNHLNFFGKTGCLPNHVWFCKERKDKKKICDRLRINIFIDDRFTVLNHLLHLDKLFLFKPNQKELQKFNNFQRKNNVIVVESWGEVIESVL